MADERIKPDAAAPGEMTDDEFEALMMEMMKKMKAPETPTMSQEQLSAECQRLAAARACENILGRWSYLFTAGRMREIDELFAHSDSDRIIMPYGMYTGADAARRCFVEDLVDRDTEDSARYEELKGRMMITDLCTPVIEVAGDGKTAKALWVAPGLEAHNTANGSHGWWSWARIAADLILTGDGWRIWHLGKYMYFSCRYDENWAKSPKFIFTPARCSADAPAPIQYYYSADAIYPDEEPPVPVPYESWTEN